MRSREVIATALGMMVISTGTFYLLSTMTTRPRAPAPPTAATPMVSLPGTIYLTQHGSIYALGKGAVRKVGLPQGLTYSQPAVSPDGSQLALVGGDSRFTDLFLATPQGELGRRVTDDRATEVALNHWAFYPRFAADGTTIFYSWDPKNPGNTYRVDLAVYALDLQPGGMGFPGEAWTQPDEFTGGDVSPQPVPGGGLLYAGYSVGETRQVQSRIWLQTSPGIQGRPLTELAANCGRPTLNAKGDLLAMICSPMPDMANLVVVPFSGGVLGTPLLTIEDQVAAAPAWSPDGRGLAYLAAGAGGTAFDLWWIPLPGAPAAAPGTLTPAPRPTAAGEGRRQVTNGLDLDANSAPAWSPT